MNGETQDGFPYLPVLLIVLAFDLFLATEAHAVWRVNNRFKQQDAIIAKRIEQVETQISASRTWQTMLEGIANDLLELGKTDGDVRKIVEKYQIRKNQPVTPPESNKEKDK
jgi:hypothetical protein